MIHTRGLRHTWPGEEPIVFPDISCAGGETLLVLGPSGSGKTTLLHLLSGLIEKQEGSVEIDGEELFERSGSQRDTYRGRNIGIIFQTAHFMQALSVEENLLLAQQLAGIPRDKQRISALLEQLGLKSKALKKPSGLSVGEQQRVAIARALVNHPGLILADEPTSALDDLQCEKVFNLIREQAEREQAALIIVTHDQRLKDRVSGQIELKA